MQVTATTPVREHERPMSWARAILIATGFFFVTAILTGQLPGYVFTTSTLSTLAQFEQGMLDLALLAIGIGVLCFEISFLYDPKPLIPWILFAVLGLGASVVGLFLVYMVSVGQPGTTIFGQPGWPEFLPSANWPTPGQSYLFHPAWFQLNSIDIPAVGMIAILIGLGMFFVAVLNPLTLAGKLAGPLHDLVVRVCIGAAFVTVAAYLTVYTFTQTYHASGTGAATPSGIGNVLLFIALVLAMAGALLWLLPVMVARRQRFMPAVYLHGVVGLLGTVGVPLLIIWAVTYPLVNLIHGLDPTEVWVQCSQKTVIPGSCSFTPFTGYIIAAIVFTTTFGLLIAGLYFWSTRRDTVVMGGLIGMLYLAIAVTVIHVSDPIQLPIGLIIATAITIVAFVWVWSTQREFAPTAPQQLGCTGQWLVLGTLLLIYLFGFAVFSMPNFFESEALALFYQPGRLGLHDAYWATLILGGLTALQLTLLIRRRPMSRLRKFALWVLAISTVLELIGAIQGFHANVLTQGVDAMEGSHAFFLTGMIFQAVGVLTCLLGAVRARSMPWIVTIIAVALVGIAVAIVAYSLPEAYPELVVFGVILASVGAYAYSVAGPDPEEELAYTNGNGNSNGSFVVTR
jgi:hypothetical protein